MKRFPWLIVMALVLAGLILATGVAYAGQLDNRPLAGFFRQGQSNLIEAQGITSVEPRNNAEEDDEIEILGTVTSITTDTLVVDTTAIALTPETIFKDEIVVGDMVKVEAFYAEDGTLTARKVELDEQNGYGYSLKVMIVGYVDSFTSDSIVVSGVTISVTEQTKIVGDIELGDVVRVHAYVAEDDSLTAWKIKWLPDAVVDPGNGDHVRVIGGVVDSINGDSIVVSGVTFVISPETIIVGTVEVGDYVNVKAYTDEDGSLTALRIVPVRGGQDGGTLMRGNDDRHDNGNDRDNPGNDDRGRGADNNPSEKILDKIKGKIKDKDDKDK